MRDVQRGAAGVSAFATADGVDVVGWCRRGLDPEVASARIRAELRRTHPEPEDLVDDFDYLSIWCTSSGEVDGGMQTREPRRPLAQLVAAADTWLAEGGLGRVAASRDS